MKGTSPGRCENLFSWVSAKKTVEATMMQDRMNEVPDDYDMA
ncbi:MAG: hypothetical protein ACE5EE_01085 [Fidelibacterota bacterium]